MRLSFSDIFFERRKEGTCVTLKIDDKTADESFFSELDKMTGKKCDAVLTIHKKRKSKDANAFYWALATKIAVELRKDDRYSKISKEDIYREHIKSVEDNFYDNTLPDEAVDKYIQIWQSNGIGWMCEVLGRSARYKGMTVVRAYYGSSQYDSSQMSRLIDLAVSDCKALNINIDSEELKSLIESEDPKRNV